MIKIKFISARETQRHRRSQLISYQSSKSETVECQQTSHFGFLSQKKRLQLSSLVVFSPPGA